MLKQLLKNKKGTAEVIGSVMFIVILLFFFTNVYLWHDTATKEMNDLYVQKLNSPISIVVTQNAQNNQQYYINITNKGGVDATLSNLWINEKSTSSGPDTYHTNSTALNNIVVEAGGSYIKIISYTSQNLGASLQFKVITTTGNSASFTLR
jgi:archaellum component FlaF (FlaF/FlaG flagellin family)